MKPPLLAFWIVCAGCAANPAGKHTIVPSAPELLDDPREISALSGVASAHGRAATAPARSTEMTLAWRGLDLSKAPVTTDVATLPAIWEPRPAGSTSYEIRDDVTVIPPEDIYTDGTVYWIRSNDHFYVQRDGLGLSTLHFYGPFDGDPSRALKLPRPAGDDESEAVITNPFLGREITCRPVHVGCRKPRAHGSEP